MLDENSTSDVFRFLQVRPPLPVRVETATSLIPNSQFARELSGLPAPLAQTWPRTVCVSSSRASIFC
jgi:hypothetical protein